MRRAAALRIRRSLVAALFLGAAFPVAGPLAAACAASGSAALVVDTGETSYTYCVSLPEGSVSGIELIQLAGEQHSLQYRLGYGGGAVCQLQNVGPEGQDCFADHPNFWGYWRGDGSGGWAWSGSGAASTRVEAGDVEGWSWGSGQDGSSHQQPPATAYSSVCSAPTPPPDDNDDEKKKKRRSGSSGSSGPSGGGSKGDEIAAAPATSGAAKSPSKPTEAKSDPGESKQAQKRKAGSKGARHKRDERDEHDQSVITSPSPVAESVDAAQPAAVPVNSDQPPGAPVTGLAALGVAAALGGAGFFLRNRRGKPGS